MDCVQKPSTLRKTKMCAFYANGDYARGDACGFAHQLSDLQSRPDLQKTRLCNRFERKGVCRDGEACKYAHGAHELRASTSQELEDAKPRAPRRWADFEEAAVEPLAPVAMPSSRGPKEAAVEHF